MKISYGVIYIDGVKVVVSSDGSCNLRKCMCTFAHFKGKDKKCYGVRINNNIYRLHRIMAKVFIDPEVSLIKSKNDKCNMDYNHRIIFLNDDTFDLRIENIKIVNQKYSLDRNKKEENRVILMDLKCNLIDTGTMLELAKKYSINQGSIRDAIVGNNKSITSSKLPNRRLIAMRVRDYSQENVKKKIQEAKDKLNGKKDITLDYQEGILQIDINGKYKLRTITGVKKEFKLKNAGGLYMALQNKRNTCCGYVWVSYKEYKNNPDIAKQRLNRALNHGLSARTLKAFPDVE